MAEAQFRMVLYDANDDVVADRLFADADEIGVAEHRGVFSDRARGWEDARRRPTLEQLRQPPHDGAVTYDAVAS